MSITTLDHVIEGAVAGGPQVFFTKGVMPLGAIARWQSFWGIPGIPASGLFDATITGTVFDNTSTPVPGSLPFRYPGGGAKCYLGRFLMQAQASGAYMLADRLWQNQLNSATTASQTFTPPAWPARDNNASTNGEGVLFAIETWSVMGATVPTPSLLYTNSAGVGSRAAGTTVALSSTSNAFYPLGLQAGDLGVRGGVLNSLQFQTNSWTSGSCGLVAYRPLAFLTLGGGAAWPMEISALTGSLVEMFPGTVPFLVFMPSASNALNAVTGCINYLHR
jgi:hypothetical protein